MRNRHSWITTVFTVLILFLLTSCDLFYRKPAEILPPEIAINIDLGKPIRADGSKPSTEEDYQVNRESYVLSYNNRTHNPNWVAWHLERSDWGRLRRPKYFYADEALPAEWEKVDYNDYDYSTFGFHRGHMCPNGDRNGDEYRQYDTFYMTNMVPQAPLNNTGAWVDFESYIRRSVGDRHEAYIVSGPYGKGGYSEIGGTVEAIDTWTEDDNDNPDDDHIYINVPEYTWKVVIILGNFDDDLLRINNGTPVSAYAIWVPNSDLLCSEEDKFQKYAVSIDYVEEMTGYDFFSLIDDTIENEIESRILNRPPDSI